MLPPDPLHEGPGPARPPVNFQSHSRPIRTFLKGFCAECRVMGRVHACWIYTSRWSCRFWPTPGMGARG